MSRQDVTAEDFAELDRMEGGAMAPAGNKFDLIKSDLGVKTLEKSVEEKPAEKPPVNRIAAIKADLGIEKPLEKGILDPTKDVKIGEEDPVHEVEEKTGEVAGGENDYAFYCPFHGVYTKTDVCPHGNHKIDPNWAVDTNPRRTSAWDEAMKKIEKEKGKQEHTSEMNKSVERTGMMSQPGMEMGNFARVPLNFKIKNIKNK